MLWIISSVNACRQASQNLGHPVLSHTRGKTPAKCHFSAKPWQIRNFIIAYQNVVRVLSCTQHEEMLLSDKDSLLFKKNWQTCLCQQTEHHAHETRISVFFCTVSTGCTYLCLFWLHNIVMDFTRLSLTSPHVTDCTKWSWISQCCRGILHKYKDVEIKTLRELNRWSMWKANKKVAEKVEPKMQKKTQRTATETSQNQTPNIYDCFGDMELQFRWRKTCDIAVLTQQVIETILTVTIW